MGCGGGGGGGDYFYKDSKYETKMGQGNASGGGGRVSIFFALAKHPNLIKKLFLRAGRGGRRGLGGWGRVSEFLLFDKETKLKKCRGAGGEILICKKQKKIFWRQGGGLGRELIQI